MMWDVGDTRSRGMPSPGYAMPSPHAPQPPTGPGGFGMPSPGNLAGTMPLPEPAGVGGFLAPPVDDRTLPHRRSAPDFHAPMPASSSAYGPGIMPRGAHEHHSSSHHHKKHHRKHSDSGIVVVTRPAHHQSTYSQPQIIQHHSHSGYGSDSGYHPSRPINTHTHPSHQPPIAHPHPSNGFLLPPKQPHPHFQYSACTGRKRALCIGINYTGTKHALKGCVNDARHMRDFLVGHFMYAPEDIVLLSDHAGQREERSIPTRRNILDAFRWLVKGARTNDSLFLHYSGHGGQTKDRDGDEVDGWDEVIYPLDYRRAGHIVDDEMHRVLVQALPAGCRLTAIFDSCHSGTVLDLPYIYSSSGRLRGSHVSNRARARKSTPADVISWSGCKDGQTSADTFAGGVAVGAMSYAFISSLRRNKNQSYQQLLGSVREILYERYTQKPQLGSSHHIDTNLKFVM